VLGVGRLPVLAEQESPELTVFAFGREPARTPVCSHGRTPDTALLKLIM